MAADRDLLFGLLALKNDLIDENQLADGVRAWTADKAQTLADHLVSLGHLTQAQRPAVEAMATIHVAAHDGRAERSLAVITDRPVDPRDAQKRGRLRHRAYAGPRRLGLRGRL